HEHVVRRPTLVAGDDARRARGDGRGEPRLPSAAVHRAIHAPRHPTRGRTSRWPDHAPGSGLPTRRRRCPERGRVDRQDRLGPRVDAVEQSVVLPALERPRTARVPAPVADGAIQRDDRAEAPGGGGPTTSDADVLGATGNADARTRPDPGGHPVHGGPGRVAPDHSDEDPAVSASPTRPTRSANATSGAVKPTSPKSSAFPFGSGRGVSVLLAVMPRFRRRAR